MEKKTSVDCILCAIRDKNPEVALLEVFRANGLIVSVNLYPYTSGHVIIFPERHVNDPRHLTPEESENMHSMMKLSMDGIDNKYAPAGYNIGYNVGNAGGASIPHLHLHVVPRYGKELGIVDILSGSKIIIEDPTITHRKLTEAFREVSI